MEIDCERMQTYARTASLLLALPLRHPHIEVVVPPVDTCACLAQLRVPVGLADLEAATSVQAGCQQETPTVGLQQARHLAAVYMLLSPRRIWEKLRSIRTAFVLLPLPFGAWSAGTLATPLLVVHLLAKAVALASESAFCARKLWKHVTFRHSLLAGLQTRPPEDTHSVLISTLELEFVRS